MGAPQRIGRIWPVVEASHFVTLPVALAGNARNPPVHDLRRGMSAEGMTHSPGSGQGPVSDQHIVRDYDERVE
jgi:hypothetical protein